MSDTRFRRAYCTGGGAWVAIMRRRLRAKENRVGSKRWGVALRVGIQGGFDRNQQPIESNSPAKACAGPEESRTKRLDQTSSSMRENPSASEARDPGGIIPLRWATSFRNPGRHYPVIPGRLRRNPHADRVGRIGGDVERVDIGDFVDRVIVAPGRSALCSCCGWWRRRIRGKRRAAWSPASAITRGTTMPAWPATLVSGRDSAGTRAFDSPVDFSALV